MTIDYNVSLADSTLDAIYDTNFPAGSFVELRTGAPPGADSAAAGTLLATVTLPATPWNAAATNAKTKNGTWAFTGVAAGSVGHYRMKNAADTKREEGTVTAAGGGGDMTIDNVSIAVSQNGTINSFTRTL
jgi:hypothetical protein